MPRQSPKYPQVPKILLPPTAKAVEPREETFAESTTESASKGNTPMVDKMLTAIEGLKLRSEVLDKQVTSLQESLDKARDEKEKTQKRISALSATVDILTNVESMAQAVFETA